MKIAVASMDGKKISPHFGRSACFVIYSIQAQTVQQREVRTNRMTGHGQGECQGEHHADPGAGRHSHGPILQALHDCETVIAQGMGRRMVEDFSRSGIQVFLTDETEADRAVELLLAGRLQVDPNRMCGCGGGPPAQ